MPTLTVLMVTRLEQHAWMFLEAANDLADTLDAELVIGVDHPAIERGAGAHVTAAAGRAVSRLAPHARIVTVDSHGAGYLEACLNQALDVCTGEYVLRIDDDERVSDGLAAWLAGWAAGGGRSPLYAFPRAALWPDDGTRIDQPPWWPDAQARLATRVLSRRSYLHEMWQCEDVYVPHPILHYTYLCHDVAWHDRQRAAYARARPDCPYPMPREGLRTVPL